MNNLTRCLTACIGIIGLLSLVAFRSDWVSDPPTRLPKKPTWFPQYDVDPATFQNPPLAFGPYARWWWPGNDVTKAELQREINLFADNAFGGVEVQTLALGLPLSTTDVAARVRSWDTPTYYENLKTALEEARKRGMTVDLTDGSGWPPGGSFLDP
ncbi:hypothetical protein [Spirosoma utsteinense]|uniref:Uncharacterized protein n=1 Tax=Spirosoma utsteinense TaxID=2585773 RepID=A0ABR6WBR1_9BACT|nr:hypothetical protein [Spirosoma utsteinense]MBC3784213.1 hypothetical protein [Spirosoma utsteinense]MBC3794000.1 hypothetical protein [Spirosoma utsteinense]